MTRLNYGCEVMKVKIQIFLAMSLDSWKVRETTGFWLTVDFNTRDEESEIFLALEDFQSLYLLYQVWRFHKTFQFMELMYRSAVWCFDCSKLISDASNLTSEMSSWHQGLKAQIVLLYGLMNEIYTTNRMEIWTFIILTNSSHTIHLSNYTIVSSSKAVKIFLQIVSCAKKKTLKP